MNGWRWFALLALPVLTFAAVACGGGGDDDDANTLSSNEDSSGDERQDSSNASGKLKLDGKDYTLDMETCELGTAAGGNITVLAGKMEGEDGSDFNASGVGGAVAIAVRLGDKGYIAVAQDLDVDGKSVKWSGDLLNPTNPGDRVKGEFSLAC